MGFMKKGKRESIKGMFDDVVMDKSFDSDGNQRITLNSNRIEELMFSLSSEEHLRNIFDRSYDMLIKEKGYEESDREITWKTTFLPRIKK